MKRIYCCYSIELRNFLHKNGIKYDICGINPRSNNMFWAYIKEEKLDKYLLDWSNGVR